ncbi:hypothetical protein Tco_1076594 [Tanacetum coccineum]
MVGGDGGVWWCRFGGKGWRGLLGGVWEDADRVLVRYLWGESASFGSGSECFLLRWGIWGEGVGGGVGWCGEGRPVGRPWAGVGRWWGVSGKICARGSSADGMVMVEAWGGGVGGGCWEVEWG